MSVLTLYIRGKLLWPESAKDEIPAAYITSRIKAVLPEYGGKCTGLGDRIFVVQAGTGSGKSFLMPVEIFRIYRSKSEGLLKKYIGKDVVCTQPRILTAVEIAKGVGQKGREPDLGLGFNVGYQTGPLSDRPPHGLIYVTIGVLATQLKLLDDSTIMDMYRCIIVDEVHERSIESDVTLMRLNDFYRRNIGNPKMPILVLTSATINPDMYLQYFGITRNNYIQIVGSTPYPVTRHWLNKPITELYKQAISIIKKLLTTTPDDVAGKSDILFFVPSAKKTVIDAVEEALKPLLKTHPFIIMKLDRPTMLAHGKQYRTVVDEDADMARPDGTRWVILATTIAETGITLKTLKYVIDSGWQYSAEIYYPAQISGLVLKPYSQSRFLQRSGRVGRKAPGEVYPLYTEDTYNKIPVQQESDIVLQGVMSIITDMVYEQQRQKDAMHKDPIFLLSDINTIDIIPIDAIWTALDNMTLCGYLTNSNESLANYYPGYAGITKMGVIAKSMSMIDMFQSRTILAATIWGVYTSDIINMFTMIGIRLTDIVGVNAGIESIIIAQMVPQFIIDIAKELNEKAHANDIKQEMAHTLDVNIIDTHELDVRPSVGGKKRSRKHVLDTESLTHNDSPPIDMSHTVKVESTYPIDIEYRADRIDRDSNYPKRKKGSKPFSKHQSGNHSRNDQHQSADKRRDNQRTNQRSNKQSKSNPNKKQKTKKSTPIPEWTINAYRIFSAIICDTMIEKSMLVSGILCVLQDVLNGTPSDISKYIWSKLDKKGINTLLKARDDMIEAVLVAGINPFSNSHNSVNSTTKETFHDLIARIKHCLYDGYRHRLLTLTSSGEYVDRFSNIIALHKAMYKNPYVDKEYKPRYILTNNVTLASLASREESAKVGVPLQYKNECVDICVLDGYVNPDVELIAYRFTEKVKYGRGYNTPQYQKTYPPLYYLEKYRNYVNSIGYEKPYYATLPILKDML